MVTALPYDLNATIVDQILARVSRPQAQLKWKIRSNFVAFLERLNFIDFLL